MFCNLSFRCGQRVEEGLDVGWGWEDETETELETDMKNKAEKIPEVSSFVATRPFPLPVQLPCSPLPRLSHTVIVPLPLLPFYPSFFVVKQFPGDYGRYWSIKSWYVTLDAGAVSSTEVRLNVGDKVFGKFGQGTLRFILLLPEIR